MSKHILKIKCDKCNEYIEVEYSQFKPFPKMPNTDVKIIITKGCEHISEGNIKYYIELGKMFEQMQENRRIDFQEMERKEEIKKLKELGIDIDKLNGII